MAVTKKELKAQFQTLVDELNAVELPAIQGTKKQLPYATEKRNKFVASIKENAQKSLKSGPSEWSIEYLKKDIELLRTRTSASRWMA